MEIIYNHRLFMILECIILYVLGSLAIALPIVMTVKLSLLLGIFFIIVGAYQILRAIVWRENLGGWIPTVINLISYIVIGILLLALPERILDSYVITLLLSIWFGIDGITKTITGGIGEGYTWLIYSGIVAIAFAPSVWLIDAVGTPWMDGVLVGVNWLFTGLVITGYLFASLGRKNYHTDF